MLKRVLIVGPFPPTVGGITSCIEQIINSNLKEEYEFIPFTTSRPTSGVVKDVSDYSILFKMKPGKLVSAAIVTFYHLIKYPFVLIIRNLTLVHIHTTDYLPFFESCLYIFLAKLLSKKVIIHIHAVSFESFYNNGKSLTKAMIRKMLGMADKVIVLSRNTSVFFKGIVSPHKIAVITNAIDTSSFRPRESTHREMDHSTVKVLFVGGDEAKRKGLFDILRAIPIVFEKCGRNILFIFVGRNDKEKEKAIGQVGRIYPCIKSMGFLEKDQMSRVRLDSDIYILPSYAEGLPIALLEAMATGLPVVSTRVGSVPEVIEEGMNGFLIAPGDYKALANRIIALAQNKTLRLEMGTKNVEKIRSDYSIEKMVLRLERLYQGVTKI